MDNAFQPVGELPALPYRVVDQTGTVEAVSVANPGATEEGVQQVPGRDDVLSVLWMGGMCDRGVLVTVDGPLESLAINVRTERDFGGCRMAGVFRNLLIEFSRPVDASTVQLSMLD